MFYDGEVVHGASAVVLFVVSMEMVLFWFQNHRIPFYLKNQPTDPAHRPTTASKNTKAEYEAKPIKAQWMEETEKYESVCVYVCFSFSVYASVLLPFRVEVK